MDNTVASVAPAASIAFRFDFSSIPAQTGREKAKFHDAAFTSLDALEREYEKASCKWERYSYLATTPDAKNHQKFCEKRDFYGELARQAAAYLSSTGTGFYVDPAEIRGWDTLAY